MPKRTKATAEQAKSVLGRRPSGPPFTRDEVQAIVQMRVQRRWTPDGLYQRVDNNYRISRTHFDHLIQREGKRRPLIPEIRSAFAKAFGWPEGRQGDFPLGCIDEFLSKLPVSPKHFIGRNNELKFLNQAWQSRNAHIVSLVAQGGTGKTALVNAWLSGLRQKRWDGARRVYGWSFFSQGAERARQKTSAEPFLNHALERFGETRFRRKPSWEKGVRLAGLLQNERVLLVLDGIETLQHPPGKLQGCIRDPGMQSLLRELARSGHPGMCVITTRWTVGDLSERDEVGVVTRELLNLQPPDAAQLLWELGANKWADHELAPESLELRKVAKEFKYHALAVMLLGRFIAVLHDGDIRKRALIPPLRELPDQEGSQAFRIMRSYERVLRGKPELAILRLLGLFDRPAEAGALKALLSKPMIERVTDRLGRFNDSPWKFAIESLRAFYLIDPKDPRQPDLLDCHPLIREYFGDKLEKESKTAWKKCHFRLYEYFRRWSSKSKPEKWEQIEPLYRAMEHGCKAGYHQKALNDVYIPLIAQDDRYYAIKVLGAFAADLTAISFFFSEPPWSNPVPRLNPESKALVLGIAGWELRAIGRLREAKDATQAALKHFKNQKPNRDNMIDRAINAANLSELSLLLGELTESVSFGRECVTFADKSKDNRQMIVKRARLADSLHQAGEYAEAKTIFHKTETLLNQFKPEQKYLSGWSGFWCCDLLLTVGQTDEVLKRVHYTMKIAKKIQVLSDIGLDYLTRARAKMLRGKATAMTAKHDLEKAIGILGGSGMREFHVRALLAFADYHQLKPEFKEAWDKLEEAREIAERGEMKLYLIDYQLKAAHISLSQGKKQQAVKHFTEACRLAHDKGYGRRRPEIAELARRLGRKELSCDLSLIMDLKPDVHRELNPL